MPVFIIDLRDQVGQQVTLDADAPLSLSSSFQKNERFVKVVAASLNEAIRQVQEPLRDDEKAAQLLLSEGLGKGWSVGPQFPGDTIRKSIARLERLGYWSYAGAGRITTDGRLWLAGHHMKISLS